MLNTGTKKQNMGFTLIEMLVSIAVFGIVAVIMTGIILNMASVSYTVDRRTDFLNIIETSANNIKNEMRNAANMGLCSGTEKSIFVTKKPITRIIGQPPVQESYQLIVDQNQLVWKQLTAAPISGNCVVTSNKETITPKSMFIQNLTITISTDSSGKNTLVFISFEACDSQSTRRKIFNCDTTANNVNPYRYMFAISTRNF